jgi:hypothetical protein
MWVELTTFQLNVAVPAGVIPPGLTLIWAMGSGPEGAVEEAGGEVTVVVAVPPPDGQLTHDASKSGSASASASSK